MTELGRKMTEEMAEERARERLEGKIGQNII